MTIARYEEQWESSGNHSCLRLVEVVPGSNTVGDWCRADDVDKLEANIQALIKALDRAGNSSTVHMEHWHAARDKAIEIGIERDALASKLTDAREVGLYLTGKLSETMRERDRMQLALTQTGTAAQEAWKQVEALKADNKAMSDTIAMMTASIDAVPGRRKRLQGEPPCTP